jgi:dTDP-4-amino-4,6-dideoxygalactose transaminase
MIVTEDEGIAEKVSSLRDHGATRSDLVRHLTKGGSLLPEFDLRGYNFRMTDLQGALGVSQIGKADRILGNRRELAGRYHAALENLPLLGLPVEPPGTTHGYQSYVCLFGGEEALRDASRERVDSLNEKRNRFMSALEEEGVATRQGTHAVHTLGYYRNKYGLRAEDYPNAYAADRLSVALPLYAGMTDEEFGYVVSRIREQLR